MTQHVTVLKSECVDALSQASALEGGGGWILDLTFGGGGHSRELMKRLPQCRILGVDQDPEAIERGKNQFQTEIQRGQLVLYGGPFSKVFSNLSQVTQEESPRIVGILADLGVSSDQINDGRRGFSFAQDGPLDMRMDPSRGISAREFLKTASREEIERILWEYGQERYSRRIVQAIVQKRTREGIPETTKEFSKWIVQAYPPSARKGRIHCATRSFQAIRIFLNDELGELDSLLSHGILGLCSGGRVAVISFHSLEDRRVKVCFRELDRSGIFKIVTKKPILPGTQEVESNIRARSAKLRVAEKR